MFWEHNEELLVARSAFEKAISASALARMTTTGVSN